MVSKRKRSTGESNDDDTDSAPTSPSFEPQLSVKEEPVEIKIYERYGPYVCSFYLPKNRLRYLSTFFKEAMTEKLPNAISLHGMSPHMTSFSLFAAFVASGRINDQLAVLSAEAAQDIFRDRDYEWRLLCRAWRLGSMLQSDTFQDIVLDTIAQKVAHEEEYSSVLHGAAYAGTPAPLGRFGRHTAADRSRNDFVVAFEEEFDSSMQAGDDDAIPGMDSNGRVGESNPKEVNNLRKLVVDIGMTYKSAVASSGLGCSKVVAAFLGDVIRAEARKPIGTRAQPPSFDTFKNPGCRYHQHSSTDGRACYKKIFQSWSQE